MQNLTITIPARNEERNLGYCLEAIGSDFAQCVVVIDSASTDATASVTRRHGAELIDFQWNGHFPKNAGLPKSVIKVRARQLSRLPVPAFS